MTTKIQIRRDTTINWNTNDPILLLAEIGIDITTGNFKIGDGVSKFSELEYFNLDAEFTQRKLSSIGDFTGTWNGLPMQTSEVGLATDWNSAKGTFPTVTQRLNNSDSVKANIANMFYPNNVYGGILSSNFNNITTSGFYTGYGTATGAPNTSSSWFILHINSNVGNESAYQQAKSFTTSELYYRNKTSSSWGSWTSMSVSIINNLTTTVTGSALDAAQGKALGDLISTHTGNTTTAHGATTGRTASTIILRDGNANVGVNGVSFPASQSASADANTLDDYEEGTFVPVLYYQNPTGITRSYTAQTGVYTKTGNLVHVCGHMVVNVSGTPANDNIGVGNLPFTGTDIFMGQFAHGGFASSVSVGNLILVGSTSNSAIAIKSAGLTNNLADDLGIGTAIEIYFDITFKTA